MSAESPPDPVDDAVAAAADSTAAAASPAPAGAESVLDEVLALDDLQGILNELWAWVQQHLLTIDAAWAVERVVDAPAPVCNSMEFGDSSVNFDLRFWITDPQNGLANARSQVLMGLWESLHEHGIEIPFPQRDLHVKSWASGAAPPGADAGVPRP